MGSSMVLTGCKTVLPGTYKITLPVKRDETIEASKIVEGKPPVKLNPTSNADSVQFSYKAEPNEEFTIQYRYSTPLSGPEKAEFDGALAKFLPQFLVSLNTAREEAFRPLVQKNPVVVRADYLRELSKALSRKLQSNPAFGAGVAQFFNYSNEEGESAIVVIFREFGMSVAVDPRQKVEILSLSDEPFFTTKKDLDTAVNNLVEAQKRVDQSSETLSKFLEQYQSLDETGKKATPKLGGDPAKAATIENAIRFLQGAGKELTAKLTALGKGDQDPYFVLSHALSEGVPNRAWIEKLEIPTSAEADPSANAKVKALAPLLKSFEDSSRPFLRAREEFEVNFEANKKSYDAAVEKVLGAIKRKLGAVQELKVSDVPVHAGATPKVAEGNIGIIFSNKLDDIRTQLYGSYFLGNLAYSTGMCAEAEQIMNRISIDVGLAVANVDTHPDTRSAGAVTFTFGMGLEIMSGVNVSGGLMLFENQQNNKLDKAAYFGVSIGFLSRLVGVDTEGKIRQDPNPPPK